MPMPPMQVPLITQPFPHQQMNQHQQVNPQQQQRFFQNNQNQFNQRQKQTTGHNNGHPYQQRQMPLNQMPKPQGNQQAANPFIPLQASRKATKPMNIQGEAKKIQHLKEQNKPQKEAASSTSQAQNNKIEAQENATLIGSSNPVVDMRKNRLAIDFSTLN